MTQQQFDILIWAILLSPFITKLLVGITNAIFKTIRMYHIRKSFKSDTGKDFLEALLEAVEKQQDKENKE